LFGSKLASSSPLRVYSSDSCDSFKESILAVISTIIKFISSLFVSLGFSVSDFGDIKLEFRLKLDLSFIFIF